MDQYNDKGNTKKFLYTGAKQRDEQSEDQWIFSPRKQDLSPRGGAQFDLDDVWSIKKNVSIGVGKPAPASDGLNLNANKSYYSRYGGGPKGNKDEFDSSFGNPNYRASNSETGNKSRNYGNKGFSYSSYNNVNNGKSSQTPSPYNNKNSGQSFTNHRNNQDNSLW